MKKILLSVFLLASIHAFADHLKGGFFTYQYLGPGTAAGSLQYHVTLTVYMVCNPNTGQLSQSVPFTFFDAGTNQQVKNVNVSLTRQYQLSRNQDDPCIRDEPLGCYYLIVVYDLPSVELPANTAGYVISYQRCCRIINIQNINGTSSQYGNTYSIKIPGSGVGQNAQQNNSATFQVNDTAVVCHNNYFQTSFLASDPDGDSLSYSFCESWGGGGQSNQNPTGPNGATPDPAAAPPYAPVPYAPGFTGTTPLGAGVTINARTGLISGTAPPNIGRYVITVCVNEWRNGVLIATNRKELLIEVGDCGGIKATLDPSYITCDGFNLTFSNSTPSGINSYSWDFGVAAVSSDTANTASPTYTYSDTGTYVIKLVVNRGQSCSDSTTALAKVYPGFFPGFKYVGVCVNKPTQFIDTTNTRYGFVNTWRWDFGETTVANDTSHLQNPTYSYPAAGTKSVTFIVSNSKGCIDTVTKNIDILTKPPLRVAFKDTLICRGDSVQLHAIGNGVFSWTPALTIFSDNTPDPTVFPTATANYFVKLDDQGCIAFDTVKVNVIPFVTVAAMPDTTICATDTLRLYAATDGLKYLWNNAATLNDPALLRPTAKPVTDPTVYILTSTVGHCSSQDSVQVRLVPYPVANAGPDTTVCFYTFAQLHGSTNGSSFTWSPTNTLTNAATLTPLARSNNPVNNYVLTAYDTRGCPKPGRDTVTVYVNPEVIAFAGSDTAVVVGQTLQLAASGGINYLWSPATALSNPFIPNPKAVYNGEFDSVRYTVTVTDSIGCTDEATVLVKIFRTAPKIFVPTAFTPNGDGRNEYVAAIAVGITKLDYFRIYNRWGQLVFQTTVNGKGWDGRLGGVPQGTGVYVWVVRGTDYTGKVVFDKGTVTLIR